MPLAECIKDVLCLRRMLKLILRGVPEETVVEYKDNNCAICLANNRMVRLGRKKSMSVTTSSVTS